MVYKTVPTKPNEISFDELCITLKKYILRKTFFEKLFFSLSSREFNAQGNICAISYQELNIKALFDV